MTDFPRERNVTVQSDETNTTRESTEKRLGKSAKFQSQEENM